MNNSPLNLVVLISGNGSNLQAILDNIAEDKLHAKVAAVISDRADAHGLERAERAGVPAEAVTRGDYASEAKFYDALRQLVNSFSPDLVALAGFMRILPPRFVRFFPDKIINIHPSLLPKLKGLDTHRRALAPYQSTLNECQRARAPLQEALNNCQRAFAPIQETLNASLRALGPFQSTLNTSLRALGPFQSTLNASLRALDPFQSKLNASLRALDSFQSTLNASLRALDPIQEALNDCQRAITTNQRAFAPFQSKLNASLRALDPFQEVLTAYQRAITTYQRTLTPHQRTLNECQRALNAGERWHGASVHMVTEKLDAGQVILQARVTVTGNDTAKTLANRVLRQEHRIYSRAIQWFAENRAEIDVQRLPISEAVKEANFP